MSKCILLLNQMFLLANEHQLISIILVGIKITIKINPESNVTLHTNTT